MKITIKVKTNAKVDAVEQNEQGEIRVLVKAPPQEGKANVAVVEALAKHFGVSKREVAVIGGFKSKTKIIRVGPCDC